MYRLTPRMRQHFKQDLVKYHELFSGGRCKGWELEELIYRSIQSDNVAQHHALWREAGHDDKADITVRTNGEIHYLQIKSGSIKAEYLTLSGHRLGRFNGDMQLITAYLNNISIELISVPYKKLDDEAGRHHMYQIAYIDSKFLRDLCMKSWQEHGKAWQQINKYGVVLSLRPSMSWQIWWKIPEKLIEITEEIVIG